MALADHEDAPGLPQHVRGGDDLRIRYLADEGAERADFALDDRAQQGIATDPVEPAPHTTTWSFMRFILFFIRDANRTFLRSPSMMNAVIVDAKNTIVPVPNTSNTIVNPRAYGTMSMFFRTSP